MSTAEALELRNRFVIKQTDILQPRDFQSERIAGEIIIDISNLMLRNPETSRHMFDRTHHHSRQKIFIWSCCWF